MQSKATSPKEYIDSLPADRKKAVNDIRKVLLKNLPAGFEEVMNYGMLGYVVPHSIYPDGYHCNPKLPLPLIGLGSQKNYIALHHMGMYEGGLLEWFLTEWGKVSDKKPDMGKCCIRFKKPEDIPLELISKLATKLTPKQWIAYYESTFKR